MLTVILLHTSSPVAYDGLVSACLLPTLNTVALNVSAPDGSMLGQEMLALANLARLDVILTRITALREVRVHLPVTATTAERDEWRTQLALCDAREMVIFLPPHPREPFGL